MNHASVFSTVLFALAGTAGGCTILPPRQAASPPTPLETSEPAQDAPPPPLTGSAETTRHSHRRAPPDEVHSDETATTPGHIPSAEMPATIGRAELGPGTTATAWHVPPKTPPSETQDGRPYLVLATINTLERVELAPLREDGGFSAADVQLASYVLRDRRGDEICPIDPRLLDLAYRVQRRFGAAAVRALSGCRVARHRPSNHSRGRALDFVIPGSSNTEVASFAQTLGFVGVGVYPNSGFIHLDTRPNSYFWVDTSGPGKPSRMRPVLARQAALADAKALARGETPPTKTPQPQDEDVESTVDGETFNTSTVRTQPLE